MCESCACQTGTPTVDSVERGREFAVAGMTCQSCASKVGAAVREVAGVTGVNVDVTSGRLIVAGEVDEATVRAAVTGAGYRITEP